MFKSFVCIALLGLASAGCVDDVTAWCEKIVAAPSGELSDAAKEVDEDSGLTPLDECTADATTYAQGNCALLLGWAMLAETDN